MTTDLLLALHTMGAPGAPQRAGEMLGLGMSALALLALIVLGLLVKAGSVGLAVWFHSTYPQAGARLVHMYRDRGKRCFVLGLVNTVLTLVVALVLLQIPVLGLLGLLLLILLFTAVILGYATAYYAAGERILAGSPSGRVKPALVGGATLAVAFAAPVIGQLLSLGVLFRGLGAVTLSLLSRIGRNRSHTPATAERHRPEHER